MTTGSRQCKAITGSGARCNNSAIDGDVYCWTHSADPEVVAKRKAARSRGGKARHGRSLERVVDVDGLALESMTDVLDVLEQTLRAEAALENSTRRNRALAYICKTAVDVLGGAALEAKVTALAALLERIEHLRELEYE